MLNILYVGVGGFIGSALRYAVSLCAAGMLGPRLPCGTLFVNVLGGILIGLIMDTGLALGNFPPELRLFLTTGILGGFTTFSTFSYETISLFASGSYGFGALNICLNLFLSLGGVMLGKYIAPFLANALR